MVDELGHWEDWRDRASQIRDHVLSNLDAYLYQLSEKVTENGGHVYFAKTKEDATRYILQVAQSKNAQKVVKSKSMVTEEIGVNHVLQDAGIQVIETDLGNISCNWIRIRLRTSWSRLFIKIAIRSAAC